MREIKFRALLENETGRWWEYYTTLHEPAWSSPFFGAEVVVKDLQYTGLLDKNGREIYEGDIVTVDGVLYFVEWRGAGDWFIDPECDDAFMFTPSIYELEIIGNIHENPELLS